MTLIEQNPARHLLDRMVTCQHCGAPMESAGESLDEAPRYVCITKNKGCGTPDIDAGPFNRLILRTVINAILDENNISKVTEIVHEEALKENEEAVDAMLHMQRMQHRRFNHYESDPLYENERYPLTDEKIQHVQKTETEYLERWEQAGPYRNAVENPRKVRQYALNLDTLSQAQQHPHHQGHFGIRRNGDPGRTRIRDNQLQAAAPSRRRNKGQVLRQGSVLNE